MMKRLHKLLIAFVLLLCCSQEAEAVKAYPRPITVTQPDGTKVTVRIHGNESFHYITTVDGFLISKDAEGFYRYVDYDFTSGRKSLTLQRVHNVGERDNAETTFVSGLKAATLVNADIMARKTVMPKSHSNILKTGRHSSSVMKAQAANGGETQFLVVLVNFADCAMHHGQKDFDAWLNEPGYSVNGGTGSVKDYYRDNSMGAFVPNFKVVGPYTLAHEQVYYAGSDESGADINPREMVYEACQMAKADNPDLDFSQFDNDGDGFLDNCYIIYAGYSEASTADENDMWPHSWTMGDDVFSIDGVTINDYSCSAELVGMPGAPMIPTMDGIGTFTHEFGHILGLKDMYDTDSYTNGNGVDPGAYSLYASGSYNNESRTPPCLMAFERLQMGWATEGVDIVELKGAEDVTLESLAANKARYINAQPGRADGTGYEWFVLENRQKTGWDAYIPAHGLLIYHYDYTQEMVEEYWSVNGPNNNAKHRCLYIKPADGVDDENSRSGDTFPGSTANTSFTDTTTPGALNWSGEPTNVPVTNIKEEDGLIKFQVCGGTSVWDFVRTNVPSDVRDSTVVFTAEITGATQDIVETGFCWSTEENPTLAGTHQTAELSDNTFSLQVGGLQPGTYYNVRAYMTLADGTVSYGSPLLFATECATGKAPFVADFMSWTNGQPDCWQIVDRNGDGTTWILDESAGAIVYQFDYWNNADDWLVSKRRIHVPANGALYFTRGISGTTTVEDMEVYVSTKSSDINDFFLHERLSFADYFDQQHVEEVDLSAYAGQDIYIAFRCCSEKLQNNLWLWAICVTEKLGTPQITNFSKVDDDHLLVEWTPVDNAYYYYLFFGRETDEDYVNVVFAPMSFYENVTGDVTLGVGTMNFTGDATVELVSLPDGILDLKFIATSSGPMGTSELFVDGSVDGVTWTGIGPRVTFDEYDSEGQECDWETYVAGQGYTKLRFRFVHGGRNVRVKYLTLEYNDGKVIESCAEGSVYGTSQEISATVAGEFSTGRYAAWVAAGDGILFYDESETAICDASVGTSITDVIAGTDISMTVADGTIRLDGLKAGQRVTCTSAAGAVLYSGCADAARADIDLRSHRGVVVVSVDGNGESHTTKVIVN